MGSEVSLRRGDRTRQWFVWVVWVAASAVGILVGFAAMYALIFAAKAVVPDVNEDRLGGAVMFPVVATLLGISQWLVLRRRMRRSGWWILATVVGVLVAMAAAAGVMAIWGRMLPQQPDLERVAPVVLAIVGFMLGLAQLPVIYRHIRGPALWVLASAIGWFGLGLVTGKSLDRAADILALGAIPAAVTGLALVWLWREPNVPGVSADPGVP